MTAIGTKNKQQEKRLVHAFIISNRALSECTWAEIEDNRRQNQQIPKKLRWDKGTSGAKASKQIDLKIMPLRSARRDDVEKRES